MNGDGNTRNGPKGVRLVRSESVSALGGRCNWGSTTRINLMDGNLTDEQGKKANKSQEREHRGLQHRSGPGCNRTGDTRPDDHLRMTTHNPKE